MMSHKPTRAMLPHCVTIWNAIVSDTVVNGSYAIRYQKTVIRYVRYTFREAANMRASGGTCSDKLFLMIFPDISVAESNRRYVSPAQWQKATDSERALMWTLQKDTDYIGLGDISDELPSIEGNGIRNDYKITTIDMKFGVNSDIHHFEVNAV